MLTRITIYLTKTFFDGGFKTISSPNKKFKQLRDTVIVIFFTFCYAYFFVSVCTGLLVLLLYHSLSTIQVSIYWILMYILCKVGYCVYLTNSF